MRRQLLASVLVTTLGCHSTPTETTPAKPTPPPAAPVAPPVTPVSQLQLPQGSGIDETNLDRSVNPCDDFYQFACGGWLKKTEIPADRARWGSFNQIDERNQAVLRKVLEDDAAGKGDKSDAYTDKLGAFWTACMDEAQIEKTAQSDLKAELAKIDKIKKLPELVAAVTKLQLGVGNPMFDFGSQQDFGDATQVIAGIDQGGIALPDKDYYLKDDAKMKDLRDKYLAHVEKMFTLAGEPAAKAKADAATAFGIEKQLAQVSMARVDRRDPKKIYHRINLAGLEKAAPHFPWKQYLKDMGHPTVTEINVTSPEYFTALDAMVQKVKIDDWRTYLRWNFIHHAAPLLSKAFVDESFSFFGKTLNGTPEIEPRWKRCVSASDRALGFALAQSFVRITFGTEGKQRTEAMVQEIEKSMQDDLDGLAWMDDATRKAAVEKLHGIANKIAYPDKWRSYDKLEVTKDSYLKNVIAASTFESHRQLDKIGKPVDRTEWDMTPPTVNAYYNPSMNEMVFPAGILQPPFYNNAARDSVNVGAIGMVMGHELTHGFDDQGRQFDAVGNLRDWWTPKVNEEFDRRAGCVIKEYDGYVAVEDLHLNGKLTLGENIADLGGLKLAYRALGRHLAAHPAAHVAGQFSDEQLFFLGSAQAWCSKTRPENARVRALTDPHSPPEFRVTGMMSNMSEFAHAFQCKAGDKMVRADQCTVW